MSAAAPRAGPRSGGAARAARTPGHDGAEALAIRVARRSIWIAGFAAAALVVLPAAALAWASGGLLAALCLAVAATAGLGVLALSALLRFDAALFRYMSSHGDEVSGGMRVDDFLARAGLRTEPAVIRRLTERAAGTRRIETLQLAALALLAASFLLLFASLAWSA